MGILQPGEVFGTGDGTTHLPGIATDAAGLVTPLRFNHQSELSRIATAR